MACKQEQSQLCYMDKKSLKIKTQDGSTICKVWHYFFTVARVSGQRVYNTLSTHQAKWEDCSIAMDPPSILRAKGSTGRTLVSRLAQSAAHHLD